MPITDNNFTAEEFTAATTANPELLKTVTGTLAAQKFVVRSEADNAEWEKNYSNRVIGEKTREHATELEKAVFESTGIEKTSADEKYYDYYKRAFATLKGSVEKATKELDEAKKAGGASAADQARIQRLEKALEDAKKEQENAIGAKDKELSRVKVGSAINNTLSGLRGKYKPTLDKDIVETVEGSIVGKLLERAEMRKDSAGNDIVVFLDEKGDVRENPTTLKPLTPDEVLGDALKSLIDTGRKVEGTGTKGDDGKDAGTGKFTGLPGDVKTQVQASEYLSKLGLIEGSTEYNKIWEEHVGKLPLR